MEHQAPGIQTKAIYSLTDKLRVADNTIMSGAEFDRLTGR
jgi:hypothetical protein